MTLSQERSYADISFAVQCRVIGLLKPGNVSSCKLPSTKAFGRLITHFRALLSCRKFTQCVLTYFHVRRCVRVGNMSHTELLANRILIDFFLWARPMVVLCSNWFHLSQLPCFFWASNLVIRGFSLPCQTSSWSSSLCRCFEAELDLLIMLCPIPSRPCVTVLMMLLYRSLSSADLTATCTCRFLP